VNLSQSRFAKLLWNKFVVHRVVVEDGETQSLKDGHDGRDLQSLVNLFKQRRISLLACLEVIVTMAKEEEDL